MDELSEKEFFQIDTATRFVNKFLTEYSLISLYEDKNNLAEFREKYLEKAEKEADMELTIFLKKFKGFHILNFADVSGFENWLKKIKTVKLNIFENKSDNEDMRIAAQYLAYNEESGKLSFVTCDKEFHRSLNVISKHFQQATGRLSLISPPKKR